MNKAQINVYIKKYVKRRNVVLFLLVFIVLGWFCNWWIVKYPLYKVSRISIKCLMYVIPEFYYLYYNRAFGIKGPMRPPEYKDVDFAYLCRDSNSGKEISEFYQNKFLDRFKGNDLYKIEYHAQGEIGVISHKIFDSIQKFEPEDVYPDCYFVMRVIIGGHRFKSLPQKSYIQLRDGNRMFEKELSVTEYREVIQKALDSKLPYLDYPVIKYPIEHDQPLNLYQQIFPFEKNYENLVMFNDIFTNNFSKRNSIEISRFKTWLINRFPEIKSYPVKQLSVSY